MLPDLQLTALADGLLQAQLRQDRCDTDIVNRERATVLVEHMLRALDDSQAEWPLSLITDVYIFGSFARGALEPHDVDVDIEFEPDLEWGAHFAGCLAYGRDPFSVFKRSLTGGKRGCQFQFNYRDRADFKMTLLWRRGGTLQTALERLHAIQADPAAGRAERDAMLPEFDGLDQWIPLALREGLVDAVGSGAITMERLVLTDGVVISEQAHQHLLHRWQPTSPLYRAASAVIADWERRSIDPGQGHLHGSDIRDRDTPYFAGFGLRHFKAIPRCLTEFAGREWIEVVHPTRTRPLDTLRILPGDRQLLKQVRWS